MELKKENNIISFRNVGMRYGNSAEVLSDVTIDIKKGDFVFLTGNSGAGKTSFLSLLYMENKPVRGQLKIFNSDVSLFSRDKVSYARRKIGVVFQDYMLLDHLSVYENVALPLRLLGKNERYIQKHVMEMLNWIEMGKHIHSKPYALSGGQRQRIAIARAVIHNPEILIADEPTASVDDKIALKLLYLFVELNKRGTTVILSTHNKSLIDKFDYGVITLHKGRIG